MKTLVMLALAAAFFAGAVSAADAVRLPAPQKSGGPALLDAVNARASAPGGGFPSGQLSQQDLSTLLWAASGLNRDGRLWTVPMAMGRPPYCKLYVITKTGTSLYDWRNHALVPVSSADFTGTVPAQGFAKAAPVNLIVVVDGAELAALRSPYGEEMAHILAGAMSQNVYLAAQAVNAGARLIYSIDRNAAVRDLGLSSGDVPLFSIVLGKK